MEAEDEYSAGCSFSLMCQEESTDLDDDGGGGGCFAGDGRADLLLVYNAATAAADEDEEEVEEYMDHLVSKESSFCSSSSTSSSSSCCFSDAGGESAAAAAPMDWFALARRATVKWILETRGCFGFCHRTAYLAIAYFDRFCLRRCIDRSVMPWAARLLAVACVSLAAKMEEYRAPALSEFRAGGGGGGGDGDDDGYEFSCVSIRRMELLVLSTLDWRMAAVTPFDYLPCLSSRLRRHEEPIPASVLDHRPSTVAAAAVLAATHGALTREAMESKMSSLSPSFLLDKEDVFACYSAMLSQPTSPATKSTTTTTGKRSSSLSSSSSSCSESTDAASSYDAAAAASCGSKRMRLELPGGILR
uniref:Cyclin-like domain-containing protein n=1 Tax=Oryza meridionalis TaxID=40149 RepID=A0A0E0D3Q0_9ORYZ